MRGETLEEIKNDFLEELEPLEIRQKDKSIMLKAEEYKYFAADMSMTENILEGNVPFFFLEALQEINRDYIFTDYSGLGVEIKKIRNIFDDKEISLADFKKKVQETKEYKERKEIAEEIQKIEIPQQENEKITVKYDGKVYTYSIRMFDNSCGENPEGEWIPIQEITENGEQINFDKLPIVLKIFFRACR